MRKICLRCGSKFGSRAEYCPHDGSLLVTDDEIADPLIGTVLLEQFRIDEQIGTGGMGTVYRAHQTTVGRDVAIKVLRSELARDEQAVFRFEREGRVAISLDHPNLVRVFLSGRLKDGRLYIVMELLEGRSLADELDREGVPSLERVLIMIMKLCAGLGAVHAAGIVHRDIKPENVYLVRRGRDNDFVKLVDFGIARVLEGEGIGPTTTQNGRVFGTATYISPEAATGEDTDQRSDIYSMGVLSYQLLTGELPFEGKTAGAVLMQHVHQDPPLLQTVGRGAQVPDDLAGVVMRALSKDPGARQQSLAEFLNALSEAAGQAGLLDDARALLFGTIWGEDLAAPGSYLAELLGSSAPPGSPSAMAATQPVQVGRDPEEEALLSSAPQPFGTTAYDLVAPAGKPNGRKHRWLWASLGLLSLIMIGLVAGTLWLNRRPRVTAEEIIAEPVHAPPTAPEKDTQLPDVGTNAPGLEQAEVAIGVSNETEQQKPLIEEAAPDEPILEPAAQPKAKKKKRTKKQTAVRAGTTAGTTASASAEKAKGTGDAKETGGSSAFDDGIDWSVPDFPEEPPGVPNVAPGDPAASPPPSKPRPPTGTPDVPAQNPVVIDEPPVR
jgi:serine/threonine protein kinase